MPLYEYKCHSCGKTFEVIEKFSAEPLKTHAGCGGAVERLISAPAFHLKGTGWYATDYAKSNGGKPGDSKPGDGKSDAAPKTDAGSSDSRTSESKSESKSDSKTESKKTESKPAATDSK
ncbi:MAG: zinc ribbon domain-containing protein [Bryobacteraceae bacterium]|jgi:putative FmdB family regulatory protein